MAFLENVKIQSMIYLNKPHIVIHGYESCPLQLDSKNSTITTNKDLFDKWFKLMGTRSTADRSIEILNAQLCWACCIEYNQPEGRWIGGGKNG